MNNWPHQDRALELSRQAWGSVRRWTLVAPPGAGKTHIMHQIVLPAAEQGVRSHIYVHRIMLCSQIIRGLQELGVDYGVIAAKRERGDPNAPIQVCMLDTVFSRMKQGAKFDIPKADICIVDEKHQQTGDMAKKVLGMYQTWGAREIGFTATPVGLAGSTDQLINAGSYSELLECQAHLPMQCWGIESPDTSQLKHSETGEYSSKQVASLMRVPTIFARVFDHWRILNPRERPAIGYAPDVPGSRWFNELFFSRGVRTAHIDGERTVLPERTAAGPWVLREYPTDDSTREAIQEGSRSGDYRIVWNRFVLREAIDMPWLYHAILATAMGGLSTCLQSVGRIQRFWAEYADVIVQDHGGNIDRHGMPDMDRQWKLGDTNNSIRKARKKKIEKTQGVDAEPICCPKCMSYRTHGAKCPNCGHVHSMSSRWVRQLDGELVRKKGRVIKYKRDKTFDDVLRSSLFAIGQQGGRVRQAVGMAVRICEDKGIPVPNELPRRARDNLDVAVRSAYPWTVPKQKARAAG